MGRHGENIHKRKDGRWEARIITGRNTNGKAIYTYLYGKTYLEVKNKKKEYIVELNLKKLEHSSDKNKEITVQDLIKLWLNNLKPSVKESTYATYSFLCSRYILPVFAEYRLSSLTQEQLDNYLKHLLEKGKKDGTGLSAKTVTDIRTLIVQILAYADEHNFNHHIHRRLFSPRHIQPHIVVLSRLQQARLENILFHENTPICIGILLSLYTGLRIGEICALKWGDFTEDLTSVNISTILIRITDTDINAVSKTKKIFTTPKTFHSIRTIPLPEFFSEYLKEYHKDDDCYVITGTKKYIEPRTFENKYKRILKLAELPDFNFHTMRHTFATRCVEEGFDIKTLSELLGHSSVTTTMQRYVHPSMDMKKKQMNRLCRIHI